MGELGLCKFERGFKKGESILGLCMTKARVFGKSRHEVLL